MPKISVIIPAYNAEHTIEETIHSVLNQTFTDFELIVIDDGSKDRTVELAQAIQDDRINVIPYENGGVATARNRGITHAQGEYISFLDHDDLWTRDKLETQLQGLETYPKAGVAYSWTLYMHNEAGNLRYSPAPAVQHAGNIYTQLLMRNFIESGSNILARRETIQAVGGFDSSPKNCEDWDYYLRLAENWEYVVVPAYQILYRQSATAMSSQIENTERGGLVLFDKVFQTAPEEIQKYKARSLSNHYRHCAGLYLASAQDKPTTLKALRLLQFSIQHWPLTLLKLRTYFIVFRLLLNLMVAPSLIHQMHTIKVKYFNRQIHDPRTVSPDPRTVN